MILFLNVLLTSKRFSRFDRGLWGVDDPLAVFRFMLASLEDLEFSRAYVFCEVDPDDYPPEAAALVEAEARQALARCPAVEFRPRRLYRLGEWRDFLRRELLPRDDLVFYSGNHDHIYLDHDRGVLDACLATLAALRRDHGRAGLVYTHWPEWFPRRAGLEAWLPHGFVQRSTYRDAIQVLTPELLEQWFIADAAALPDDAPVRRSEDIGWAGAAPYVQLVPHRELFRHYDADSHFGLRIARCPPLRIPGGLLEGDLRIACFRNADTGSLLEARRQGYFCVGPWFAEHASRSAAGADEFWTRADLPPFMLRRCRELLLVGSGDDAAEARRRDERRCELMADILPLTPETLAQLAPPAVRGAYPAAAMPELAAPPGQGAMAHGGRRGESWFVLKTPVRRKSDGMIVMDWERRFSLSDPGVRACLRAVSETHGLHYTLLSERRGNAWHAPAASQPLVGDLFDAMDGLAIHSFDFWFNKAETLRRVLAECPWERIVLLEPAGNPPGMAAALAGLGAGPEGGDRGVAHGLRAGPALVALAAARPLWERALAELDRLYCGERHSLVALLARHFGAIGRYRESVLAHGGP
ncbi:MAG: hypothetical protein JNK22_14940 [Rhodocyclaceae bacterium]|nr:hypothetical protein [Rhodocyclaceae bacterium]